MKPERHDQEGTVVVVDGSGKTRISGKLYASLTDLDAYGSQVLQRALRHKRAKRDAQTQPELIL